MPQPQSARRSESGFSLAEVLVATAILATALVSVARLFAMAIRVTTTAREATVSAVLAGRKLEELRSVRWSIDDSGAPAGEAPASGVDYVDERGVVAGTGPRPPRNATYVRTWSVEPLPAHPAATLVLRVAARRVRGEGFGEAPSPEQKLLLTARTRKAR